MRHTACLEWLADFLTDQTQIVRVSDSESAALTLKDDVSQGSVTGPKRLTEYTEDATLNLTKRDMAHHLFADDTQGMLHWLPVDVPHLMSNLSDCFADGSGWCASRRLQLNKNKTELLLFGTACSLKKIPLGSDVMLAGPSVIKSAVVVRDRGVMLDAHRGQFFVKL